MIVEGKVIIDVKKISSCFFLTSKDPKKNFALEKYGKNSKCFDHTNEMWEERTCKQVRQWQHWGSGCYQYKCEDGRVHVMVSIF